MPSVDVAWRRRYLCVRASEGIKLHVSVTEVGAPGGLSEVQTFVSFVPVVAATCMGEYSLSCGPGGSSQMQ